MFATVQDSSHLRDISERQAFVTEEIKEEMEDGVIPPSQKAMVLRYIKAVNFGMYFSGTSLFLLGVFAPHYDYLSGMESALRAEPIVLFVLLGILGAFGAVQIYRSFWSQKPHYMLSGVLSLLIALGCVIFVLTDLSWVSKYYIVAMAAAMGNLQYCQDWDFHLMMDKFLQQIRSEASEYRMRARTGEEVLTQPVLGSLLTLLELRWIFGCTTHKSRERMDLEEETHEYWGNYILKDRPGNAGRAHGEEEFSSTEDQLISAYRFAIDNGVQVPYKGPDDPRFQPGFEPLGGFNRFIAFMEGLTTQLSWVTSLAFAGLEIGNVLFGETSTSETPRIIAIILAVLTVMAFLCNTYQAQSMMTTSLGLTVAEREWLAIDWMDRIRDKKLLRAQATDDEHHRMNLTYFWLCASAVADAWGAGIISKFCSNCAKMTKLMFEDVTSFEFIGYNRAKFSLMIWGNLINGVQVFLLSMMSVVWFGSFGIKTSSEMFWASYVLMVCVLAAGLRIKEAVKLWSSMEAKRNAQNYLFGIMVVAFLGMMLVVITCLVPIILGNGNLFGSCQNSPLYSDLFPDLCSSGSASENQTAYWVVVGSLCIVIGLTIGAFFFGTPTVFGQRE